MRSCLKRSQAIFDPDNVREMFDNVREGPLTYVSIKFTYVSLVQTVINTKLDPFHRSLSFFQTLSTSDRFSLYHIACPAFLSISGGNFMLLIHSFRSFYAFNFRIYFWTNFLNFDFLDDFVKLDVVGC